MAYFFGAGNMVFPHAMGQLAGENYWQALIGFIINRCWYVLYLALLRLFLVGY